MITGRIPPHPSQTATRRRSPVEGIGTAEADGCEDGHDSNRRHSDGRHNDGRHDCGGDEQYVE